MARRAWIARRLNLAATPAPGKTILDSERLASPDLYPIAFDRTRDQVRFVRLDEAAYRNASFLDERILTGAQAEEWASFAEVRDGAANLDVACDFIFHIGHVGSTLVARLLGHSDRVWSVREPAVLRTLAQSALEAGEAEPPRAQTEAFLKLWSRTYRPEQRALVKATSFTAEIGPMLMDLSPSSSAILMFVSPMVYLPGILGGDQSMVEARTYAPDRLKRLHRRLGVEAWRLEDLSDGEMAAMGWLSEIVALAEIRYQFPDRIRWMDFQGFLANPASGLASALRRLHGDAPRAVVEALLASPDFNRYSKAPEFAYDANLRRRVLDQANTEHAAEIDRGLDWLSAAGGAHPELAQAMLMVAAAARAG